MVDTDAGWSGEGRSRNFLGCEVFLEIYICCLLKLRDDFIIFLRVLQPKASCKLETVHRFHRYSYLSGVDDAFALCMALKSGTQSKLSEGVKRHW